MPGSTTSRKIHWVYVLLSLKDKKRYIGYTTDINKRFEQHNGGRVISTRHRRPLIIIYIEGCRNEEDARRREKYFKLTGGRRFLAKRLKTYYKDNK